MMLMTDLPETIALFPLPGAILFPRSRLPLHIFEPRYLTMLGDALKTDHRMIGMIQPSGDHLHQVGCAGRVTSFSETEDGRYMITLTGVARFRVAEEVTGFQPYRRARPDWASFSAERRAETDPGMDRDGLLADLARFFKQRQLGVDWGALKTAEDELMINALSMLCPFAPEEKQALLEAPDLAARRKVLQTLISFALQSGGEDEVLQ
ncbi:LON peptidase substrate-binding domain-containing protein [Rhodobacter sp. KR11]|uniref:LON peptidase substrate-binding domain-containing protein n=1 Tax=Rhodobacter sp. KR11 TaxID=2974588 RepID=UPI00222351CE|nr:LON peptidase substrate-binding domain-containing protein [Rhodobacter sp. KR11]MCW1918581.1 LON peptidase substrate-binding domain-containing protein [Rhodobacter sp. KR11]